MVDIKPSKSPNPIYQKTLKNLCMYCFKGVFINSYRYLCICWYLALSMYVCLYVYIQLCIYRFFYLSEGLTTKWASTPTFDKPEPFSKRPFKIYVCIDLRVGVTCQMEKKRTNPMHVHKIARTHKQCVYKIQRFFHDVQIRSYRPDYSTSHAHGQHNGNVWKNLKIPNKCHAGRGSRVRYSTHVTAP